MNLYFGSLLFKGFIAINIIYGQEEKNSQIP
jgi:hypothetical protein